MTTLIAMRSQGLSRRVILPLFLVMAVAIAAIAWFAQSPAQAQLPTDFTLSVSDAGLPPVGGSSNVVVTIEPGESTVAAIGATVVYDQAAVSPTGCVALVGLGACSADTPGEITVQTVDPSGWATETDLFRVTFTSIALVDSVPLTVTVDEAYDVGGTLIAGEVTNGTIGLQLNGDVNCDNVITIADALIIAQYSVSTRQGSTCPLSDSTTQIDLTNADATGDGNINIGDALRVAQCTVGLRDCQE